MKKYHTIVVALHWVLALGIIFSLAAGSLMLAETPNSDPSKMNGLAIHMGIGIVILLLTLVRIVARVRTGTPDPVAGGNPMLEKLAHATHGLLYLGVIVMGISGISMALAVDLGGIVYFGSGEPLPENFDDLAPRFVHGLVATGLMVLIALHFLAAVYHQHVLKDGLMSRMGFRDK